MNQTLLDYDTPVGAAIHFYCRSEKKRPKKDNWDADSNDGIISGYCTHSGEFNIDMNPAGMTIHYSQSQCQFTHFIYCVLIFDISLYHFDDSL